MKSILMIIFASLVWGGFVKAEVATYLNMSLTDQVKMAPDLFNVSSKKVRDEKKLAKEVSKLEKQISGMSLSFPEDAYRDGLLALSQPVGKNKILRSVVSRGGKKRTRNAMVRLLAAQKKIGAAKAAQIQKEIFVDGQRKIPTALEIAKYIKKNAPRPKVLKGWSH